MIEGVHKEIVKRRSQKVSVTENPLLDKVSFVLPAYNEANLIKAVVQSLRRVAENSNIRDYEVIVVDDGSTDGTREEVLKISDGVCVKAIGYDNNMGKGFAVKHGVECASGDIMVFLDSDMDIKSSGLQTYIDALRNWDLIIASKRHPESRVEASFMRRFLSFGFNVLVKLLVGVKVSDTQSGLKAGKAEAVRKIFGLLSVKKYAFDVEMVTVAQLLGLRIKELPVEIRLRGRFRIRDIVRMFIDILGIVYRLRVKRWYQANLHNEQCVYKPIIKW